MADRADRADRANGADGADDGGPQAALDDRWIARLVEASEAVQQPGDRSAVVAFTIGKKRKAVIDIVDGRVTGPGDDESVAVTVPLTTAQLASFADGTESVARSYMQGDLKPVGSTGAFLAVVELFEDPAFRERLQSS